MKKNNQSSFKPFLILSLLLGLLYLSACQGPTIPPTLPPEICGDSACSPSENSQNCPADCPIPTGIASTLTPDANAATQTSTPDDGSLKATTPPESSPTPEESSLPTGEPEVGFTIGAYPDGDIRPLLGVNAGPTPAGEPGNPEVITQYWEIGVQTVRTHDYYGPLDMATMYPDLSADPTLGASYKFSSSDEIFIVLAQAGFAPYLRLGDSWNNGPGFPPANPRAPENSENWTAAAVEVVRHYKDLSKATNTPLQYVEIWNEPNHAQFWDSTPEAFYALFAETAKALKAEFPDLKIGGPGFSPSGFLAPQGQQFVFKFFLYMQSNQVPLDFVSWHLYSNTPEEFTQAAIYYRALMDSYGYAGAESHITEWNTQFNEGDDPELRTGSEGASLLSAAWIALQDAGVDQSMFYRGNDTSMDLPTFFGLFYADGTPKAAALAFSLWSQMAGYPTRYPVTDESKLYVLAGKNDAGQLALLVVNPTAEASSYNLAIENARLDGTARLQVQQLSQESDTIQVVEYSPAYLPIPGYGVQLVLFP